jgi:hypothetical protein
VARDGGLLMLADDRGRISVARLDPDTCGLTHQGFGRFEGEVAIHDARDEGGSCVVGEESAARFDSATLAPTPRPTVERAVARAGGSFAFWLALVATLIGLAIAYRPARAWREAVLVARGIAERLHDKDRPMGYRRPDGLTGADLDRVLLSRTARRAYGWALVDRLARVGYAWLLFVIVPLAYWLSTGT